MIQGSIVAIVTPMAEDGSLDLAAMRSLVDWHVAEGTDAIVVVGTTGESPTVNVEEHCALIETVVKQAAGRIPVIAGTGANSTSEAIELAEFAKKAGVPQKVGKEFMAKDKKGYAGGGEVRGYGAARKSGCKGM